MIHFSQTQEEIDSNNSLDIDISQLQSFVHRKYIETLNGQKNMGNYLFSQETKPCLNQSGTSFNQNNYPIGQSEQFGHEPIYTPDHSPELLSNNEPNTPTYEQQSLICELQKQNQNIYDHIPIEQKTPIQNIETIPVLENQAENESISVSNSTKIIETQEPINKSILCSNREIVNQTPIHVNTKNRTKNEFYSYQPKTAKIQKKTDVSLGLFFQNGVRRSRRFQGQHKVYYTRKSNRTIKKPILYQ